MPKEETNPKMEDVILDKITGLEDRLAKQEENSNTIIEYNRSLLNKKQADIHNDKESEKQRVEKKWREYWNG